jgi:hypothetical protein
VVLLLRRLLLLRVSSVFTSSSSSLLVLVLQLERGWRLLPQATEAFAARAAACAEAVATAPEAVSGAGGGDSGGVGGGGGAGLHERADGLLRLRGGGHRKGRKVVRRARRRLVLLPLFRLLFVLEALLLPLLLVPLLLPLLLLRVLRLRLLKVLRSLAEGSSRTSKSTRPRSEQD